LVSPRRGDDPLPVDAGLQAHLTPKFLHCR
jgi:hypothetical protein